VPGKRLTRHEKQRILDLLAEGGSLVAVAREIGLSHDAMAKWVREK
jgi:transposase-like protein